ncbi:ABC transporter ATP-binding protein [Jeotgalibacillus sp. S-D1]|uniref:ABC transporter ATP-binding protein n=1 Tax=Jeotgalibacillus sp. S-D1 TaxID=2552189 RepID=UPI001059E0C3|nr:ABC transporter ATP-binding protein [Jeotgalibacillus sp. S-D1]TDL30791.1 ABC transporter ATP-binding protein [Jeotgalibacillus sp. S-D1]
MITIENLSKEFLQGQQSTEVLKGVNLNIKEGEFVAIMGPSGSGKSTLLQLLGGLDVPTNGTIQIDQKYLNGMTEKERTIFRRKKLGFVFQNYQLLSTLTVEENIAFPLHADGKLTNEKNRMIQELIESVGLDGLNRKRVNLLSGGQQQRVAIARALVNNPAVLLADEPTGNLDRAKAEEILSLFLKFHHENKQTIIMVTHDIFAAGFADRIVLFRDGVVDRVISRKDGDYAKYLASFMA